MKDLYPWLFRPAYQDYLWGGDRIIRTYRRPEPAGIYAESWEVSDRPEGMSVVRNGPLAGQALPDLVETFGTALMGTRYPAARFPLLVKILDARETLSVQVHPNDDSAARFGGEAKTEMWYVLDADPEACVYAGFRKALDPASFHQAAEEGTLSDLLQRIPVQRGDAVFIPGGRVHAIGAGCLMLEVQQNSNTTYRVHDWDRVGPDGQARALHREQAAQVLDWGITETPLIPPEALPAPSGVDRSLVHQCPFFRMERVVARRDWEEVLDGSSFRVVFLAGGDAVLSGDISEERLSPGMTALIPAGLGAYALQPGPDGCEALIISG